MYASRVERDSFGDILVSNERLWGAQTQRSFVQFSISTEKMPPEFIWALALVKKACLLANTGLGLLSKSKAEPLLLAVDEILAGLWFDEFPLSIWQTGSATQTNMNMNEVLANRAIQLMGGILGRDRTIHPNDDVNLGQSSNDVIPSAMHVSAVCQLERLLLPALDSLIACMDRKEKIFSEIVKVGRTHLQDAVPLTLGQEFSGYKAQLMLARKAIDLSVPMLYELAIGGTAVGTGINAPPKFGEIVSGELKRLTNVPFVSAANKFAALAGHEALVFAHGALKTLAAALMKISTDIRWMSSGPRSGLGELVIPANEPGSSIMPGKVNPTQCEAMAMICFQVMGNDVAIGMGAVSGNFELNVFKPLILHNFLQSIRILGDGMRSFEQHCLEGAEPNKERIEQLMNRSLMLATALNPHIGYDKAAEIAKSAFEKNISLKEAAMTSGWVTQEQFDEWVDPLKLI
ncbi:class II fumarate hydratase [Polynucleobacter sp. AP-Nickl1-40-C4]|uniref:class II fumarate hydratase n=1 Tax=Polynucleobacter sp. AP-Nickl1-40-C4 TaxID=3108275 RepID=UPI002B239782|nr:class II fumarate hydratase [Polynucleobacter sp. AP-Nickl1-40-C4]MEA9569114.1 class II fumarate hydratase [Polynucleobacter sp. AP-Nickl1-40-C4]